MTFYKTKRFTAQRHFEGQTDPQKVDDGDINIVLSKSYEEANNTTVLVHPETR